MSALALRAPLGARPALAARSATPGRAAQPLRVSAAAQDPRPSGAARPPAAAPAGLAAQLEAFSRRYDFPSAGLGALCVTGYCVMRGQDPFTALSITAAATVVALLANDLISQGDT
jgi:hypothetical protein